MYMYTFIWNLYIRHGLQCVSPEAGIQAQDICRIIIDLL